MIENLDVRFALCASSARKVRRGAASLLGGRALRFELRGLTSTELRTDFDLHRIVNYGFLPRPYLDPEPGELIESYIADYFKEEIAAEGLVRNLPVFADFLEAAARGHRDGPLLERGAGLRRQQPDRKGLLRDSGGELFAGSELLGKALESWLFHEISAYLAYTRSEERLSCWRLAGGAEVDFIVGDMRIAIEAKGAARVASRHLKGLRTLARDQPDVERRIVVCLEPRPLKTDDGIEILPIRDFLDRLWDDGLAV